MADGDAGSDEAPVGGGFAQEAGSGSLVAGGQPDGTVFPTYSTVHPYRSTPTTHSSGRRIVPV